MSNDKKLDELIEKHGEAYLNDDYYDEAKQAIIDYVLDDKSDIVSRNNELDNIAHDLEYKLENALKPIRKVLEKYESTAIEAVNHYKFLEELRQALGEK